MTTVIINNIFCRKIYLFFLFPLTFYLFVSFDCHKKKINNKEVTEVSGKNNNMQKTDCELERKLKEEDKKVHPYLSSSRSNFRISLLLGVRHRLHNWKFLFIFSGVFMNFLYFRSDCAFILFPHLVLFVLYYVAFFASYTNSSITLSSVSLLCFSTIFLSYHPHH